MKKTIIFLLLLLPTLFYSQRNKSVKTGLTTVKELKMKTYSKDSTAVAVVLYEQNNSFIDPSKDYNISSDYYFRVKILKKEGFGKGTIKIPYYKKETIENIEAYTYNLVGNNRMEKKYLMDKDIFKNKENGNWHTITFTLPNIKVGSVLEYRFTKTTPYFNQLDDWEFQSDIPKIKSEYDSAILSNYKYNVSLKGYYPLDKNKPSIIRRCVKIPGLSEASCSVLSFGMNNIPAFKEEGYMKSRRNYMSRITFELESFTNSSRGNKENYTDTWKSTDRKFKSGEYFGAELRKSTFFKKNLPPELLSETSTIEKAKKIYYFIQDHFTDNNKSIAYYKINTKKTFNDKIGTVAEINVSLMNALIAAGFNAKIALSTTRDRAEPTKIYPVISEFNYILVKVIIEGKEYFLDASNKQLSFGQTPFKTLNGDVRVLDFKKGSYWQPNSGTLPSSEKINLSVKISTEGGIKGRLRVINTGYDAYFLRSELSNTNEDSYLEDYENDNQLEINDYKASDLDRKNTSITQNFDFNFEDSTDPTLSKLYLNPFFHEKISTNPFKLEKRLYPANFGYKLNYQYRASISIPVNYTIGKLPESRAFSLPNKGGNFIFNIKQTTSKISILFKYNLSKVEYTNEEYFALKEFFNQIVKVQSTLITLEKK